MRRVVIDPRVLVTAIITPAGPPADLLRAVRRRARAEAVISGDRHLLELENLQPPVLSPRVLLEQLGEA